MDRHKVVVEYSANVGGYAAEARRLRTEIEALNASIVRTRAASAASMAGVTKDFSTNLGAMKQWTTGAVAMEAQGIRLGKSIEQNNLTMARQKQLLKDYRNGVVGARGAVSELAKEQVRMSRSVVNFYDDANGKRMASVSTPGGIDFKQQATQLAVARQEMQIYNRVLAQNAESTINWGKNTQWAGRQIMVGMTIPLMMMGAAAKNVFIDIDKELTRLGKVYGGDIKGVSDQAVAGIKDSVKGLGKELASEWGVSMKETVGLAADVAATGKEGNDLLVSTREAMRLSVLGEVDRQEALKATLSLQSAFKLSNLELVDSVNLLNAVENQTSTSLEDLSTAIPKAGPVVKALGGDVGDLAAMLVAMKEGGIAAAEGANAIKSGLASMINPTKQASQVAEGFGIDLQGIVDKNQGKLMPTMLEFQKALMGLDEFKRAKLIETIFGKYQFARISALFENLNQEGSQSLEVFKLMGASSTELAQTAEREMTRLTESTSMRWQRTLETFKANLAPLGEAVTKVFTGVLNAVNVILDVFEKLPDPIKAAVGGLAGFAALVGPILMIAGIFGNFIGQMMKGFAVLRGKKFGVFELLTQDIVAANAATGHLVDVQFSEQRALMEINSVMEKQIKLLRELAAGQQAVAATAPGVAQLPTTPAPADTKRLATDAAARVDYGSAKRMQDDKVLEGGWLASDPSQAKRYKDAVDAKFKTNKAGETYGGTAVDRVISSGRHVDPAVFDEVGGAYRDAMRESVDRTRVVDPDYIHSELQRQFPEGHARDVATAMATGLYQRLETPLQNVPADIAERIKKMPMVDRGGSVYQDAVAYAVGHGVSKPGVDGPFAGGHVIPASDADINDEDSNYYTDKNGNRQKRKVTKQPPTNPSQTIQPKAINAHIGSRPLTPDEHLTTADYAPGVQAYTDYAMQESVMRGGDKDLKSAFAAHGSTTRTDFMKGLDKDARASFDSFAEQFGRGQISIQKLQAEIEKLSGVSTSAAAEIAKQVASETESQRKAANPDSIFAARAKAETDLVAASRQAEAAEKKLANARKGGTKAGMAAAVKGNAEAQDAVKTAGANLDAANRNAESARAAQVAARQQLDASRGQQTAAKTDAGSSAKIDAAASKIERAAVAEQGGLAGGGAAGGRMSNFARSAEGQTMGLGMGAMGVGMLTGNEKATEVGMALSAVSMVAMGFNGLASLVMPRFTVAMTAATAAAGRFAAMGAGGMMGKLKGLSAGMGTFLRVGLNPATLGLAAIAGAGLLAYKVWETNKKKAEAERANNGVDWEQFGISQVTASTRFDAGGETPATVSEAKAISDSDSYKKVKDQIWNGGNNLQADVDKDFESRYRANTKANALSSKTKEEAAARQKEIDKFYSVLATELEMVRRWDAIREDVENGQKGVSAQEVEKLNLLDYGIKEQEKRIARIDALYDSGAKLDTSAELQELTKLANAWTDANGTLDGLGFESAMSRLKTEGTSTSKAIGKALSDALAAGVDDATAAIGAIDAAIDFQELPAAAQDLGALKGEIKAAGEAADDMTLYNLIKDLETADSIIQTIVLGLGVIPPNILTTITVDVKNTNTDGSLNTAGLIEAQKVIAELAAGAAAVDKTMSEATADFNKTDPTSAKNIEKAYDKVTDSIKDAGDAAEEAHRAEQEATEARIDGLNEEIETRNDRIDAVQKNIDKINDEAEAQKKALDRAKEAADFYRDQEKSEINYYDALSRGDYVGAANIRSDMEQSSADYQYARAGEGIETDAEKKVGKEEKKIEKYEAEIKGIEDKIAAIEKAQAASDKAFEAAQRQRQATIAQREEDKDAQIKAQKAIADSASSAEKKKRTDAKATFDATIARLKTLVAEGKTTEADVRRVVGAARKKIADTLGWTPAQTKKFADNMTNDLVQAYGSVLKKAGITEDDYRKMTGRTMLISDDGRVTFTNKTVNHDGTFVSADHTSGKNGLKHDEVDRTLQVGEYVVRKQAVQKYGRGTFESLNNMKMHTGGAVQDSGVAGMSMQMLQTGRNFAAKNIASFAMDKIFKPKVDQLVAAKNAEWAGDSGEGAAPSGPVPAGARGIMLKAAASMLGTPYSWGGGGPSGPSNGFAQGAGIVGFDCSSLMQFAAAAANLRIPRVAEAQINYAKSISEAQAKAGDLVAYTNLGDSVAHHIGMLAGGNSMIESPYTGASVRYSPYKRSGQIMEFGQLPGLMKGGTVLKNNSLARLHEGETVLTARLSEGLKKGIDGFSKAPAIMNRENAGGTTIHEGDREINMTIHASPGMDVEQLAAVIEARAERAGARVGVWS